MNDKVKINSIENILNLRLKAQYHINYEGDIVKKYLELYDKLLKRKKLI